MGVNYPVAVAFSIAAGLVGTGALIALAPCVGVAA
jgi:hypothetical protein